MEQNSIATVLWFQKRFTAHGVHSRSVNCQNRKFLNILFTMNQLKTNIDTTGHYLGVYL